MPYSWKKWKDPGNEKKQTGKSGYKKVNSNMTLKTIFLGGGVLTSKIHLTPLDLRSTHALEIKLAYMNAWFYFILISKVKNPNNCFPSEHI